MLCQVVEKQCLHWIPSDPNIWKEWINFIFNEDPDHVSKNSFLPRIGLQTRHNSTRQLKKLKLKYDAVATILDPTVMSQHKCN